MKAKILSAVAALAAVAVISFFFIPAFSGKMDVSPEFSVGGFGVRWYGIFIAIAVLAGYAIGRHNAWRYGLAKEEVDRFGFWLVITCAVCARLYFVISEWDYFSQNEGEAYQLWKGGWSILGAMLGAIAFTWIYTRNKIVGFWQMADLLALSFPVAHAIGRLGNFFNHEAYGPPTGLPWKMFVPEGYRVGPEAFYHPTFLYEAIGSLVIFTVLMKLRGKRRPGTIALFYLACYGLLRFGMEFLRFDSAVVGDFKLNQIIAFAIFLGAAIAIFARRQRPAQT